jgi:SSS family solute:Na+ symporter
MSQLNGLDWGVVGIYFIAVFGVAAWSMWRHRSAKAAGSSAEYFLASRNVGWFIIGSSLFATNIGAEHLVGLAGAGASDGVPMGQFEVQASIVLLLLGWVFVPFYLRSGVYTMPEFLERRYSPAARWYLAIVSIISYVLTKISVNIAAGGIVFTAIGVDFWTGALIVVLTTGLYTIFGGFRAVLYTDIFQMFVLIGGAVAVTVVGLLKLGGWGAMTSLAGDGMLSMWRPMTDPKFPWTGVVLGAPLLGVWYWCTDQFIVQRVLSAPDVTQARRGALFAGYLKLLPLFIFVIPGVVAYGLAKTGKLHLAESNQALPAMITQLLPAGIRGLVVAGLLAALMSSLASVFNSCSTLVTFDLYKKLHPEASERRLVWVGQVSTVVMVLLGLAWIPFMKNISEQLYTYLQSVQAYIAPPIAAVFLIGLSWKRVNSSGAMAALVTGFVFGAVRLVAELNKHKLGAGSTAFAFADMNFLHFALMLFVICSALLVVVSLATPPHSDAQLAGLTFQTVGPIELGEKGRPTLNIAMSLGIVAAAAAIWVYFSPIVW